MLGLIPLPPDGIESSVLSLRLDVETALERTIHALTDLPAVTALAFSVRDTTPPGLVEVAYRARAKPTVVGRPGRQRLEATRYALEAAPEPGRLLLYEAHLPPTDPGHVLRVLRQAGGTAVAAAAVPVTETYKEVRDGRVLRTIPRESLFAVQWPWIFDRRALDVLRSSPDAGDELEACHRAGLAIGLLAGEPDAISMVPIHVRDRTLPQDARISRRVTAIVLAAGAGVRFGGATSKVFADLAGRPVLVWSLESLEAMPWVAGLVLVVASQEVARCQAELMGPSRLTKLRHVVSGGRSRQESEYNGLRAIKPAVLGGDVDAVLIHDAARPFVEPALVHQLIELLDEVPGAIPALPPSLPIAAADPNGQVREYPAHYWAAQTPQAFEAKTILAAHQRAEVDGFRGSDSASLLERIGQPVGVVEGRAFNLKITTPHDLQRLEGAAWLRLSGTAHPATYTGSQPAAGDPSAASDST